MIEAAHQIALIPLLVMILWGRDAPWSYWILAAAFAVSWVGDSMAWWVGGSWEVTYLWLPVQFAVVVWALRPDQVRRWAYGFVGLALYSYTLGPPDVVLSMAGSAAVCWLATGHKLRVPVWIYFGIGTALYFNMALGIADAGSFHDRWLAYQAARLAAFVAFGIVVYRRRRGSYRLRAV